MRDSHLHFNLHSDLLALLLVLIFLKKYQLPFSYSWRSQDIVLWAQDRRGGTEISEMETNRESKALGRTEWHLTSSWWPFLPFRRADPRPVEVSIFESKPWVYQVEDGQ